MLTTVPIPEMVAEYVKLSRNGIAVCSYDKVSRKDQLEFEKELLI